MDVMSRRSTPERLDAARRAATLARLIGEGVSPERAESWLVDWEAEAGRHARPRDGPYWDDGWDWIAARLKRR